MKFVDIQKEVIERYNIKINKDSKCWTRTHAHVKERMICKWEPKNGIVTTFSLFHEIGHIETKESWMRRCESEYHATVFAINLLNEYGLTLPKKVYDLYQDYIWRERERGIRRHGKNLPSKEALTLPRVIYQ